MAKKQGGFFSWFSSWGKKEEDGYSFPMELVRCRKYPLYPRIATVVVGAPSVGKSSFVGKFVDPYDFDDLLIAQLSVDGDSACVQFVDACEPSLFMNLERVDLFLLFYSIDNLESFEEASKCLLKIWKESKNPFVPTVLVGNKCDLESERKVSFEEGKMLANQLGAVSFFEISCETKERHWEPLEAGVRAARAFDTFCFREMEVQEKHMALLRPPSPPIFLTKGARSETKKGKETFE